MSKKPYPALCKDCKWSMPEPNRLWNLRCVHPIINAHDSWALASSDQGEPVGSDCQRERDKTGWFTKCGMKGKLWEPK